MILLAILSILPRRSFGLSFFGVDDADERFLLLDGVVGVVVVDDDGFERVGGRGFFRLISVDEDSTRMVRFQMMTMTEILSYLRF